MPAKRTYTDEQLDYIKRYWRKYPTKLVAEQLGMTTNKVNSIASRYGLTKNKNKARTPLPEFVPAVIKFLPCNAGPSSLFINNHGDKNIKRVVNEPQVAPLYDPYQLERLHNPDEKQLQDAIKRHLTPSEYKSYRAKIVKHDAPPPRKNWLQRLVSWLLEGKV